MGTEIPSKLAARIKNDVRGRGAGAVGHTARGAVIGAARGASESSGDSMVAVVARTSVGREEQPAA